MGYWTIYTMGEPTFLYNIFIAISAIMYGAGTDHVTAMASIAAVFGVLVLLMKYIGSGQLASPGYMLAAFILFMSLAQIKQDVQIEDVFTGDVYVVTDIPLGVAAVGGITSQIGYSIAKLMDQAFAMPASGSFFTDAGYTSSLEIMTSARDSLGAPLTYSRLLKGNSDIFNAWSNYITDCTLIGIDAGIKDPDELFTSQNPMEEIKVDSVVWRTVYELESVQYDQNCTDAHATLSSKTTTDYMDDIYESLRGARGFEDAAVSFDVEDQLDEAINYVGLSGVVTPQNYVISNFIGPIYLNAAKGRYETNRQAQAALQIQQAIAQRNLSWSAEHSLFLETFRPMYTFIEGMVYAISPIMFVLMLLGPSALALVGRQASALIWIQLWVPMMTIANLYIHTAINTKIAAVQASGAPFPSLGAIFQSHAVFDTYIAYGGYMAASAPVLAGFLLSGGAVALQGVASRMQDRGDFDPKTLHPDSVKPSPVVNGLQSYNASTVDGVTGVNAAKSIPNIDQALQSTMNETSQSAHESAKRQSWKKSLGTDFMQGHASTAGWQAIDQKNRQALASNTSGFQYARSISQQLVDNNVIGQDKQESVTSAIMSSLAVSGSGSLSTKNDIANLGAALQGVSQMSETEAESMIQSIQKTSAYSNSDLAKSDETQSNSLVDSYAQTLSSTHNYGLTDTASDAYKESFADASEELLTSKDTYSKAASAIQGTGATAQNDFLDLVARDPKMAGRLKQAVMDSSPQAREMFKEQMGMLGNRKDDGHFVLQGDNLVATAAAQALIGSGSHEELIDAYRPSSDFSSQNKAESGTDASSQAGLSAATSEIDSPKAEAEEQTANNSAILEAAKAVRTKAHDGTGNGKELIAEARELDGESVAQWDAAATSQTNLASAQGEYALAQKGAQQAADSFTGPPVPPEKLTVAKVWDNATEIHEQSDRDALTDTLYNSGLTAPQTNAVLNSHDILAHSFGIGGAFEAGGQIFTRGGFGKGYDQDIADARSQYVRYAQADAQQHGFELSDKAAENQFDQIFHEVSKRPDEPSQVSEHLEPLRSYNTKLDELKASSAQLDSARNALQPITPMPEGGGSNGTPNSGH